jgi:hypothetical protein
MRRMAVLLGAVGAELLNIAVDDPAAGLLLLSAWCGLHREWNAAFNHCWGTSRRRRGSSRAAGRIDAGADCGARRTRQGAQLGNGLHFEHGHLLVGRQVEP